MYRLSNSAHFERENTIATTLTTLFLDIRTSLVNTLPITKKTKHTVVTVAHKKYTYAAFALANSLQKANSGSNWRLSSEQVGGTEFSFVCHVPGPRGISPGYFCPSRTSSQCFSQALGASRTRTRTRTNTNPNGTEANAAGRSVADLSIACPHSC